MNDSILAALEDTKTDYGGAYWDDYQRCARSFKLAQIDKLELKAPQRSKATEIGKLCHAVLRYAGTREASGEDWSDWRLVFEAAPSVGYASDLIEEASRLMDFYWLKWGESNAGYPTGAKILTVEEEWRYSFGGMPVTGRVDTVLELFGEVLLVDHKTRSSKFPDGFEEECQVRPQFLRLCALWRRLHPTRPRASMWVNGLIKTKVPGFERHIVRISEEALDAWEENQTRLAHEVAGRDWAKVSANFSECHGFFGDCWARQWCWGNEATRERLYQIGAKQ